MVNLTHTKVEDLIMTVQAPFKYDVVGSFLRPDYLKKAREEFANGTGFKPLRMENSEDDIGIWIFLPI